MIRSWLHSAVHNQVTIAPLVTFRVLFGGIMFISMLRFAMNGWIEKQYIDPAFHFKFFGFHWVPDPGPVMTYVLFIAVAMSALGIALGAFYRLSTITFFLAFTFIELIDATYYLNHYYFVSLVALILIFLPANRAYSLDLKSGMVSSLRRVPAAAINVIKFQLGLVYFLAGVAKLNPDWLLEAMPLALWLPAQSHLPLIGWLMPYEATAYVFSWAGAIYDLAIPFLLFSSRWRPLAYLAVVAFHLMTWSFFQIGMFPFIMIGATLIFFSGAAHERWLPRVSSTTFSSKKLRIPRLAMLGLSLFIAFQVLFPFRYLLYPGETFWTEQGYRFGWRVMLIEKAGYAQFRVADSEGREIWVDNSEFLTPVQEKMMSTQPDFMLQYSDHLKQHFEQQGIRGAKVHADVHVTFNGRPSRPFIDPSTDLAELEDGWSHKSWILPLKKQTKG